MKLTKPSRGLWINGIAWSILSAIPLVDLTYTIAYYGTTVTPNGAGYNFPPQACFLPFIILALLPPLVLWTRSSVVIGTALIVLAISVLLLGAGSLGVISDLIYDRSAIQWPTDMIWLVGSVFLVVYMIFIGVQLLRWMTHGEKTIEKE